MQTHKSSLVRDCLYSHESPAYVIYPVDDWVFSEMQCRMHITNETPRAELLSWEGQWGDQKKHVFRELQSKRGQNNSLVRVRILGEMMPGDPRAMEAHARNPVSPSSLVTGDEHARHHANERIKAYQRLHRGKQLVRRPGGRQAGR